MSKNRKKRSFLDQPLEEIEQAGKNIMQEQKETPPPKKEPKPKPVPKEKTQKAEATGKRKFIYLDEEVHREAKIKASTLGKTIKQFITDLILNSK